MRRAPWGAPSTRAGLGSTPKASLPCRRLLAIVRAVVIACVDVPYLEGERAVAPAVSFVGWVASLPVESLLVAIPKAAPYESGAFYKRELPCVLAALAALSRMPEIVIVDGHVWLAPGRPGLGARLLEAQPRI